MNILTNDINCQGFIWPYILEFIPNTNFSPGLPIIIKSCSNFINKFKELYNAYPEINAKHRPKIPKIQSMLARMFILLKVPYFFPNLGLEIISALPNILEVFLT